ncbi:hypothetical protein [Aureibacter tunicatorum]|uniref:Lipoprotein n=1 Tax=Aureibacter tunicatorum TaxID=866807 RepID=A0AAE3XMH9_9BACT|nr:hypothetical protein [Aureibacter tunicatorum]MDR6238501.1 hypothetical protein [Aureibacter tunicatorum]BDD05566.1 hypothetical protein AUTU_30490 [Aureibacter tunicatorum]
MKKTNLLSLVILLSTLFIFSCKDEIETISNETKIANNSSNASSDLASFTGHDLEAQLLTNFGGPAGSTRSANTNSSNTNFSIDLNNPPRNIKIAGGYTNNNFLYPWEPGVYSTVPYASANDIKKIDGWEVLYNGFTNNLTVNVAAIGLYNKYLGKFKFFYFHTSSSSGNDLLGALGVDQSGGNQSKLFHHHVTAFSATDNQGQVLKSTTSTATTNSLFSNTGLSRNHWYCFEFDVTAYDPVNYENRFLTFQIVPITRSQLKLNGSITGDITGTITGSSNSPFLSTESLINVDKSTHHTHTKTVNSVVNVTQTNINSIINVVKENSSKSKSSVNVKNLYNSLVDKGLKSLENGLSGFINSGISGAFSSISASLFGSNTTETIDKVELQANLEIDLNGEITTEGVGKISVNYKMPKDLGIFHVNKQPVVVGGERMILNPGITYSDRDPYNPSHYIYTQYFRIDDIQYTINPHVKDKATVNVSYELLYNKKNVNLDLYPNQQDGFSQFIWGNMTSGFNGAKPAALDTHREIWKTNYIAFNNFYITPQEFEKAYREYSTSNKNFIIGEPVNNLSVAVKVEVIPNDGSKTYMIQKVFKPLVKENNTYNPFPREFDEIFDKYGNNPKGGKNPR